MNASSRRGFSPVRRDRPHPFDRLAARSHALVTGGSSGIGLAIAGELARLGSHVHLVARRADALEDARRALELARRDPARQVTAHPCDVSREDEVRALFAELRAAGAMPAIVVCSAGATRPGCFADLPAAEVERLMRVNFMGTVHVLREAVPEMAARGEGQVLNVASLAALVGVFGMSAYCASKFAVRGLTECLRSELKPHGVTVSLLCPPDTDTPMLAAERAERPAETEALSGSAGVMTAAQVAAAALRGLRRGQAVILPGFEGKALAAAQRLIPGLVERYTDRGVRRARSRAAG